MRKQEEQLIGTAADTCIVVHYHEIALKGGNRNFFENQLRRNILLALPRGSMREIRLKRGRLLLFPHPKFELAGLLQRLTRVFGIAYFAPAALVPQELGAITQTALERTRGQAFKTFRVDTRRAQKAFPMTSNEVNIHVGEAVRQASGAGVDLRDAELTVKIEIFDDQALVYVDRHEGAGGLPAGVSSVAVALLSSGIDSPVAAYRMMRRGVRLVFVHFHSVPYTSPASLQNAERLVRKLTEYQYKARFYAVPFLEAQQHITSVIPPGYRVIMYRRLMLQIAEAIARKTRANALVTGDNVAQVASQTLPNLRAISDAVTMPVLRPLAGDDKQDIIKQAQQIGTFDISIEPYEDCCSLFVPGNPETRARMRLVEQYERQIDSHALAQQALKRADIKMFRYEHGLLSEDDQT